MEHTRASTCGTELLGQVRAEETPQRVPTLRSRAVFDVSGGWYRAPGSGLHVIVEQVAIVAGDLVARFSGPRCRSAIHDTVSAWAGIVVE
jgi:hypothetical protein